MSRSWVSALLLIELLYYRLRFRQEAFAGRIVSGVQGLGYQLREVADEPLAFG